MTGKCSRNRSISVHCTNKKARMCCCKYFSSEEAGNEQFRAVSSHCMQWDTESCSGNSARDESTVLAVQGVQCSANQGTTKCDCTAALGSQSCCWGKEQGRIWPEVILRALQEPGRMNTQVVFVQFLIWKKKPILKIWLVPDVDWSLCVSWLWYKTINWVMFSKLMCYNK